MESHECFSLFSLSCLCRHVYSSTCLSAGQFLDSIGLLSLCMSFLLPISGCLKLSLLQDLPLAPVVQIRFLTCMTWALSALYICLVNVCHGPVPPYVCLGVCLHISEYVWVWVWLSLAPSYSLMLYFLVDFCSEGLSDWCWSRSVSRLHLSTSSASMSHALIFCMYSLLRVCIHLTICVVCLLLSLCVVCWFLGLQVSNIGTVHEAPQHRRISPPVAPPRAPPSALTSRPTAGKGLPAHPIWPHLGFSDPRDGELHRLISKLSLCVAGTCVLDSHHHRRHGFLHPDV